MTGLCKDCRWWQEEDHYGRCNLATEAFMVAPPGLKLVVVTSGDDHADLVTSEDFGCNQFQRREEVPM